MAQITLTDAHLAFGHYPMLDNARFSLEAGEKIGLIGRNGVGKSSLLDVLAGNRPLDDGQAVFQQGLKIAFVEQEPALDRAGTVFDAVASGLSDITEKLREYETLAAGITTDTPPEMLAELNRLQGELDHLNAWQLNSRVSSVLEKLSLNGSDIVGTLSGGLYKRTALARAFVAEPDVLILDEPTNHLDCDSIIWLESLLKEFKGSLVFITHDRRFLDNVATRIVELDRGRLLSYPGNFTSYKKQKADQLAVEAVENEKFDKLLAKEEVWIRKGIEARRTRNEGRVRRLKELRKERAARLNVLGKVKMDVSTGEKSSKIVAELTGVSRSFGDKTPVKDFSATILRGEKIGVIGPNGAGKTTLLKLILGELAPDGGTVKTGLRNTVAYFDQLREQLDENASIYDMISQGSDFIDIGGTKKHVMSYLGDFLFTPERARSPVSSLSGGERNRLLLARLFTKEANVLVLDEPTNDLDVETLELLEELLGNYDGTVFLVSHDRDFLDNVVTGVIAPLGDGRWKEYVGGYSDWERVRPVPEKEPDKTPKKEEKDNKPARREQSRPKKLSFAEERELEGLPEKISQLESRSASLTERLNDPSLYTENRDEARRINEELTKINSELEHAMERWELLETKKAELAAK